MAGRQLSRLLPSLARSYSTAQRYAARAGEEVLAVADAHRAGCEGVMQVRGARMDTHWAGWQRMVLFVK